MEAKLNREREYVRKKRADQIQQLAEDDSINRRDIENKIQALKKKATQDEQDKKIILTEALNIAKKLGLVYTSSLFAKTDKEESSELMINLKDMPIYTRGTNALNAEIDAIKN